MQMVNNIHFCEKNALNKKCFYFIDMRHIFFFSPRIILFYIESSDYNGLSAAPTCKIHLFSPGELHL